MARSQPELLADQLDAADHILQLLSRGPSSCLTESAIGSERQSFGRSELQTPADPIGHVINRLDVVALHIDNPDRHVFLPSDGANHLQFGKFPAGHLDMNLIDMEIEKVGEHAGVRPPPYRSTFVVPETKMRRQPALTDDGSDSAIEDIDQSAAIGTVRITAHRRLVDRDLGAADSDQPFQFVADQRKKRFRNSEAVRVLIVGNQSAAEGIGTGEAGFERWPVWGQSPQTFKFLNSPQSSRSPQRTGDRVLAPLVVCWRSPPAGRRVFQGQALEVAIERQVEIQPRLFAVGDDIQAGSQLILDSGGNRIILQFPQVVRAELVEMLTGKFQPAGERVTADDGRSQRLHTHRTVHFRQRFFEVVEVGRGESILARAPLAEPPGPLEGWTAPCYNTGCAKI